MRINIAGKSLAVNLLWQEAKGRSDLLRLLKSLRAKDGLLLPKAQLCAAAKLDDRGAYSLAAIIARGIGNGIGIARLPIKDECCHLMVAAKDGALLPSIKIANTQYRSDTLLSAQEVKALQDAGDDVKLIEAQELEGIIRRHVSKAFLVKRVSGNATTISILLVSTVILIAGYFVHAHLSAKREANAERLAQISTFQKSAQQQRLIEARTRASHVFQSLQRLEASLPMFTNGFEFESLEFTPAQNRVLTTFKLSSYGNIGELQSLLDTLKDKDFSIAWSKVINHNSKVLVSLHLAQSGSGADESKVNQTVSFLDFVGRIQQTHLTFALGTNTGQGAIKKTQIIFSNLTPVSLELLEKVAQEYPNFSIVKIILKRGVNNALTYQIQGAFTHA